MDSSVVVFSSCVFVIVVGFWALDIEETRDRAGGGGSLFDGREIRWYKVGRYCTG